MGRFGGSTLIVLAAVLIIGGIALRLDWLTDTLGLLLIIAGILVGVAGVIGAMRGGGRRSGDYGDY